MVKNQKKIDKIKKLFLIINDEKLKNIPLNKAIEKAANELGQGKESTKNFYYKSLKFLKENPNVAKEMQIDLTKIEKITFDKFKENEKVNLITFVDENLKKGISIRKSCLILANNDAKMMLRYQNKYRNLKRHERVKKGKMNIINIDSAKEKINKKISDAEINALFMGLIKIVKKFALENASTELKNECEIANQNFRQTIIDLNKKEMELKKVYEENNKLNNKVASQQKQICLLLDRLSKRKLKALEKKSNERYTKLKNFNENSNKNIL